MAPSEMHGDSCLESGLLSGSTEKTRTGNWNQYSGAQAHQKVSQKKSPVRRALLVLGVGLVVGMGVLLTKPALLHCGHKSSNAKTVSTTDDASVLQKDLHKMTPNALHKLLHKYFPERYQHGIYASDHEAIEALGQDSPEVAAVIIEIAKRQDTNNNSSTPALPSPTLPPTKQDPPTVAPPTISVPTSAPSIPSKPTSPPSIPTTPTQSVSVPSPPTSSDTTPSGPPSSSDPASETSARGTSGMSSTSEDTSSAASSSTPSSHTSASSASSSTASVSVPASATVSASASASASHSGTSSTRHLSSGTTASTATGSETTLPSSTSSVQSSSSFSSSSSSESTTTTTPPVSSDTPTQSNSDTPTNPPTDSPTDAPTQTTPPPKNTITRGSKSTSTPVPVILTHTLPNGGTTTLTTTSWVDVVPTGQPSGGKAPGLQNAAPRAQAMLPAALGLMVGAVLMV